MIERNLVLSLILAREFPLENWLDRMSRYFSERLILEGGSVMNSVVRAMELRISLIAAV